MRRPGLFNSSLPSLATHRCLSRTSSKTDLRAQGRSLDEHLLRHDSYPQGQLRPSFISPRSLTADCSILCCSQIDLETYRAIADQHRISFMASAAEALATVTDAFIDAGVVPEADWSKMRALEFQDALKTRRNLLRRQRRRTSPKEEGFETDVSLRPSFLLSPERICFEASHS